jgi:hypothetical protein
MTFPSHWKLHVRTFNSSFTHIKRIPNTVQIGNHKGRRVKKNTKKQKTKTKTKTEEGTSIPFTKLLIHYQETINLIMLDTGRV